MVASAGLPLLITRHDDISVAASGQITTTLESLGSDEGAVKIVRDELILT